MAWLVVRYFAECADYKRLDERTQRTRRAFWNTRSMSRSRRLAKLFRDFPRI